MTKYLALLLVVGCATVPLVAHDSAYTEGRLPGSVVTKTLLGSAINVSSPLPVAPTFAGAVSAVRFTVTGTTASDGISFASTVNRISYNGGAFIDGTNGITTNVNFNAAGFGLGGTSPSVGCIGANSSDQFCITPNSSTLTATAGFHIASNTPVMLDANVGTPGSGTGVTPATFQGRATVQHWVDSVTVDKTAMTAAASTDVTIWTTPVNTRLLRVTADVTQTFTGGALSAVTAQCGSAAGGTQYLLAGSVLAATTTLGDVVAEIGAGLVSATVADMGTPAAGIPGAIAVSCRFTCTGANCSAATTGSVTFKIEGVTYP